MKLIQRSRPELYVMTFICALLVAACAQLGLATPQTFNEKVAAAIGSVTQIRSSAADLLTAKAITVTDAENVLAQTDAAAQGITLARQMSSTTPDAANARLTAVVSVLTALQAYLATKQGATQ
jgi:hypothetical protein